MRKVAAFLVLFSIGQPAVACQQFPMLFFDFDSSFPRVEAAAQLQQFAADALRRGGEVKLIQIVGHSDRTGPLWARERVAIRRAEIVRDQLISFGLRADLIKASSAADRHPLYPTADHIREPQNRRVELAVVFADRPPVADASSTARSHAQGTPMC